MRRADSATVCALAACFSCAAPPYIVTVSPSEATVVAFVRPAREAPTREAHDFAAAHLGFAPQDSSEVFRDKVEAQPPVAPTDPNAIYQGGAFTAQGPFGD